MCVVLHLTCFVNLCTGAIELTLLARHFQTQIHAYDIQSGRVDTYGAEENFSTKILLLYDGIHYDALAKTFDLSLPEDCDVTVHSLSDDSVHQLALLIAEQMRSSRSYTDTASFSLRCLVCAKGMVGNDDAVKHSRETGHQNYAED